MKESISAYLDFITETAYLAGRLTLGYYQSGLEIEYKTDRSPVTLADRAAEELIRRRIEAYFPHHSIVGEEFGLKESTEAGHRWFIDPIDGTKSFVRGVPLYATLLAIEIEGKIEAGAAYFPALDEMLAAASGAGCWWNGRRARVSDTARLDQALVTCTTVANFAKHHRQEAWEQIQKATYFQTGWGDAYGYLLVATGRAELMLDPAMEPWDAAPFPVIFREAGGYFGDWQGNEDIYAKEAIATNRILLPQVLELISGSRD
jgi:histidinol-phosphatase